MNRSLPPYRGSASLYQILPYKLGSKLISIACRSGLVGIALLKRKRLIKAFFNAISIDCSHSALAECFSVSIMGSWRLVALARLSHQQQQSWVHVKGIEHLHNAYKSNGRVIVINSHYGMTRWVPINLAQEGFFVHSLEARDLLTHLKIPEAKQIKVRELAKKDVFLAKEAFLAKKALVAGKVLHMAADGFDGLSKIQLPFLGRTRGFATGFAEFALNSEAQVIPVFVLLKLNGHIEVEYLPPLSTGSETLSANEKTHHLVEQYAHLLEQRTAEHAPQIRWYHMQRFLQLSAE